MINSKDKDLTQPDTSKEGARELDKAKPERPVAVNSQKIAPLKPKPALDPDKGDKSVTDAPD